MSTSLPDIIHTKKMMDWLIDLDVLMNERKKKGLIFDLDCDEATARPKLNPLKEQL